LISDWLGAVNDKLQVGGFLSSFLWEGKKKEKLLVGMIERLILTMTGMERKNLQLTRVVQTTGIKGLLDRK
jgi:hypothetical protein